MDQVNIRSIHAEAATNEIFDAQSADENIEIFEARKFLTN